MALGGTDGSSHLLKTIQQYPVRSLKSLHAGVPIGTDPQASSNQPRGRGYWFIGVTHYHIELWKSEHLVCTAVGIWPSKLWHINEKVTKNSSKIMH
jgi:hypothetical protein